MLIKFPEDVYLLFVSLSRLAVFHVPVVHIDVPHIDHKFVANYDPVQWGRVTASLDNIDFVGGKFLAAVFADHVVAFLVIAETGTVTDIAGIYGSAKHSVSAFEYKKSDHGAVTGLDLEMMCFAITDSGNRDFEFSVGWCDQSAAFNFG
jgi:hypothetical protein